MGGNAWAPTLIKNGEKIFLNLSTTLHGFGWIFPIKEVQRLFFLSSEYLELVLITILMLVIQTLDSNIALLLLCGLHFPTMSEGILKHEGDKVPIA